MQLKQMRQAYILLIEDNPMDVDLTLKAFSRQGVSHTIQVARDGEAVLHLLARWENGEMPPSLILLDLKLPKVSGLELLRCLKSHAQFSVIPTIVLTSSSEECDVREAYLMGANSYILKPIDFPVFVALVEQLQHYWIDVNLFPDHLFGNINR